MGSAHYGVYAGSAEVLLVLVSCILLMLRGRQKSLRVCGGTVLLAYSAYALYVLFVWVL